MIVGRFEHFGTGRVRLRTTDAAFSKPFPVAPGDFGVRLVGNAGPAPTQIHQDTPDLGFDQAVATGQLTVAEVAEMRRLIKKMSGVDPGVIAASGIATTAQDAVRRTLAAKDAEVQADIKNMQQANDDFWKMQAKKNPSYAGS